MSLPKVTVPEFEVQLFSLKEPTIIRPYLVKEEKLLLIAQQGEDPNEAKRAIKQIVRNCTYNKVNPDTLPVFDIEYLFLQLRAKSVNNVVDLKFRCVNKPADETECGTLVPVHIDLNDIKITVPEGHTNVIWLDKTLGVTMRYPTFDDAEEFTNPDVATVLPRCLQNVFDDKGEIHEMRDATPEEVKDFVESLNLKHIEMIRAFFDTMPHVTHTFTFECPRCKYTEDITLRGIADFFD